LCCVQGKLFLQRQQHIKVMSACHSKTMTYVIKLYNFTLFAISWVVCHSLKLPH
jgi:hypothetical protein